MRIALLSDLHANLPAVQACLEHARSQQVTGHAFLGDLVGYGAQPAEVVALVREHVTRGALALQGNHDLLAVHPVSDGTAGSASADWTHGQLSADDRSFLEGLPLQAELEGALLVHASADDPARWHYVDNPSRATLSLDAAERQGWSLVFCGHVHGQRLFYAGRRGPLMDFRPSPGVAVPLPSHRRWLATVGSVGQPRDGDPRAMYAVWEPSPVARITFHRVPYSQTTAAEAIRRAGLPATFADRLLEGR